mmetsp:Transcript_35398/g.77470  ORF Transcript_35398/g.77470 Transcript_35398/m.77470 type:complete len:211 (-) Transcript_35398:818-1450(-)
MRSWTNSSSFSCSSWISSRRLWYLLETRRTIDVALSISRLIATPRMRTRPTTKSFVFTCPTPSSYISKISGSSCTSMSRILILRRKFASSKHSKNSALVSFPTCAVSWNILARSFICCANSSAFLWATISSSSCCASKAFFTTIAVIKLNSTMPATPRKVRKSTQLSGDLYTMGRTTAPQLSKVMSLKPVNMAVESDPNRRCTSSSSANS